jgi:hypothetical protein
MQPDALQTAKLSDHVPHQLNLAPPPSSRAESSAETELESLSAVHYPDLENRGANIRRSLIEDH